MEFIKSATAVMAGYYVESGCDVIGVIDPMSSQISPKQFHAFGGSYVHPV